MKLCFTWIIILKVFVFLVMVLFTSFFSMRQGYEYVVLGEILSMLPKLMTC